MPCLLSQGALPCPSGCGVVVLLLAAALPLLASPCVLLTKVLRSVAAGEEPMPWQFGSARASAAGSAAAETSVVVDMLVSPELSTEDESDRESSRLPIVGGAAR